MKTRILSILGLIGALTLSLLSTAAADLKPPGRETLPPPPAAEYAPSDHIPYDPYQRLDTLPEYPYNRSSPIGMQARSALTKPNGTDLDVTYISRSPMYKRYEVWYTGLESYLRPGSENDIRWPAPGEVVTFTAHIMNKGTVASGSFVYTWFIDDVEMHSGTHSSLAPGEEATEAYQWAWAHTLDGERIIGTHTVRFAADPGNRILETYESNNSLADRTDALGLVLAVTPELYTALETPVDARWPFSAEDWLQKQISAMNATFARSVYPSAPEGIIERVRLEKIILTRTSPPSDFTVDGGFHMTADDRYGNGYYDPATDVSGALIHELSHQLGIIDTYNIGFPPEVLQVIDRQGLPVQMQTNLVASGLMSNPGLRPPLYDEHTVVAVNSNKGYRRGYFGEYLYDMSERVSFRILDNNGQPAAGVSIRLYQHASGPGLYGSRQGTIDNIPEIEVVTDAWGLAELTNRPVGAGFTTRTGHVLRDNPFGAIDVVGLNDEFVFELTKGDHQEFGWIDITPFNLATWKQGWQRATIDIQSHVPPDDAPTPPANLWAKVQSGVVGLQWEVVSPTGIVGYNVYRALARDDNSYQKIAGGITQRTYSTPYDYNSVAATYAVTALEHRSSNRRRLLLAVGVTDNV